MGMVPLHPKYCGFSLHWVSVWSVPNPEGTEPAGQAVGRMAQGAQDSLNAGCNDHHTWLLCRQRDGSNAMWQGCLHKWLHQGATWSCVCSVTVRCNCSTCKHKRACLSASSAGFKIGQLPTFIFRICAMALCSPHHYIFTRFTSNQGMKLYFAQNQFVLSLEKAQRRDCSLSWKFPLSMCVTLSHRSTDLFLQGELHAFTLTCTAVLWCLTDWYSFDL